MPRQPASDDLNDPLISILIHDYYGKALRQCLASIFSQHILDNIEIIFVDSASSDGGWEIALEYARRHPGIMSVRRNCTSKRYTELSQPTLERRTDLDDALLLAKGKYVVSLGLDHAFVPEHVKSCVAAMEADPLVTFANVQRREQVSADLPTVTGEPLVNVLIYNYNYGRYLGQCLDSVFAQTYRNFRVVFSDNASTDDSWQIACEYDRAHPGTMTLFQNRKNFGPGINARNCLAAIDGKYFCTLCSDDALKPHFIQKCVQALERHPDTAFAMTHRTVIDEHGMPREEPPFYDQSCIISGPEQAAVYMMASVNPSISQIMYSSARAQAHLPTETLVSRWYGHRLLDFDLCCHYSMAYIKEPLLLNRVHSASDSASISGNLLEVFGQYILPHQFAEMASRSDSMRKAVGRLPQALDKVGRLCLRYCTRALAAKDDESARRYYHLAAATFPAIAADDTFRQLTSYWAADTANRAAILEALARTENLVTRNVSYPPPPGSVSIERELSG